MSGTLHLYNTLTKRPEPFCATDPARVTMYTCGPTVYDDAHIGNFRAFLIADLLRRWLESPLCTICDAAGTPHAGPRTVRHAMNITDVGHMTEDDRADGGGQDKMDAARQRLLEAKKAGTLPEGVAIDPGDPYAIADFYTTRFLEDARRLGLKVAHEPDMMPRATGYVPAMIRLIQRLIDRGCAYVAGQSPSRAVYFSVKAYAAYGRLSGNTLQDLRAGAGGRVDQANQRDKRHPADFLLWKEDHAHIMRWDSPWGTGYPGWHVECSAMAYEVLAADAFPDGRVPNAQPIIDLHTGGEDNIFPHHECEIAQSCCAFNQTPDQAPFARHWLHTRFLLVDGQKMSKRTGNFYTARDLFAQGVEPAALRLALIRTHYRTNADFTQALLRESRRMLERFRRIAQPAVQGPPSPAATQAQERFAQAMHEDLNVSEALAAVNTMAARIDQPTSGDAEVLARIDQVLGLLDLPQPAPADTGIGLFDPGVQPDPRVLELLEQRKAARDNKDYAQADAIRDQLAQMGYAIQDAPGGKVRVGRA